MSPQLASDLKDVLKSVASDALHARTSWDLWSILAGPDYDPTLDLGIRLGGDFLKFDYWQHLTGAVVATYRVFDTRQDVRSLRRLTAIAEQHHPPPTHAIARSQTILDSTAPLADKVKILRHKVFGHSALDMSSSAAFEAAALTPFDLRSLQDQALEAVNAFQRDLGEPESLHRPRAANDLRYVLQQLLKVAENAQQLRSDA